eukprot:gb/GECG01016655.1/.p1 GENE.gb/GECG01016655.1/~~gb/GECG01016655.1/.p1  ORF type:complete len:381 (+),score=31.24 gb/GECG01016655.1/:1-1143(+)
MHDISSIVVALSGTGNHSIKEPHGLFGAAHHGFHGMVLEKSVSGALVATALIACIVSFRAFKANPPTWGFYSPTHLPSNSSAADKDTYSTGTTTNGKGNAIDLLRRTDRKGRLPIRFCHFHKCGGTSMCKIARRNHERVPGRIGNNCDFPKQTAQALRPGQLKRAQAFAELNCTRRVSILRKHTFLALETFLEPELCPENFRYVALFREPLARISSHLREHRADMRRVVTWLQGGKKASFDKKHAALKQYFDNYYIRFLLGPSVFLLPPFRITREHLEQAKHKLRHYFAGVFALEHVGSEMTQECLRIVTLWSSRKFSRANVNKKKPFLPLNGPQVDYLLEVNALDIELYEYVANMSLNCKQHLEEYARWFGPSPSAAVS